MNMILCGENCKHQKDGYCCLEGYGTMTNALRSPCCYFEEREVGGKKNDTSEKPE